jgi:ATP-dependent NAD(P)H-hydrate dehydratase
VPARLRSLCHLFLTTLFKNIDPSTPADWRASLVSKALGGVTVLQKGAEDIIATNTTGASESQAYEISKIPKSEPLEENEVTRVDVEGGLKRCGGQGDVLSGCVGTWLAWGKCYETGAFGHVIFQSSPCTI